MSEDLRLKDMAVPLLFHPDLNKRNIFVSDDDSTIITGIIDWQSSSIEPAFWYADEVPDFAQVATQYIDKDQAELCAKAFDACTQYLVPKLSRPRLEDEALFRPFRYCYRTWNDGAVAFRHELIETSQAWKNLGFSGSCPFSTPSAEELAAHQQEYELFKAAYKLKYDLATLLNTTSDGWVPLDAWEATESEHRETFKGALQAVFTDETSGIVKDEAALREIWPFDLPNGL